MKITILALASVLFLSACGQKGALYLPEKSPKTPTQAPQSTDIEPPISTNPNDF